MVKVILLSIVAIVIGFLVVWLLIELLFKARREIDVDREADRATIREMRETAEDLQWETDRAKRRRNRKGN